MKFVIFYICLFAGVTILAAPLKIGDEAPEIQISEWVKNGPVTLAAGKGTKVYVIEFWATWCAPCRMSIPHLSELQEQYKDKGVVFVGITKEDESIVVPFVKKQEQMNYNVGIDSNEDTYADYMDGVRGIPNAFIVNKEGIVAWSGHPLQMDTALQEIVEGTFNIRAQKEVAALHGILDKAMKAKDCDSALQAASQLVMIDPEDVNNMRTLIFLFKHQQKIDEAILFLDQLVASYPAKSQPYIFKLRLLKEMRDKEKVKSLITQYIEQFHDNASKLNSISWIVLEDFPFGFQPLKEALDAAEKAVKITPASDKMLTAAHLDTLARCYYAVGRVGKAIKEQEKAVECLKGTAEEAIFNQKLEFYREAFELGKNIK